MKFSTLRFGETCPKHAQPAPRGVNNAGMFKGPAKQEAPAVSRQRSSGDWAKWDPAPAPPRPAVVAPELEPQQSQRPSTSTVARPPVSASGVPVRITSADLLVHPGRSPHEPKPTVDEEKVALRGATTPVYLERPRPATAGTSHGLAGRPSNVAGPSASNPDAAAETYDAERVVDTFVARVAQRALEKSNFNPSPQVQARALSHELLRFGKGSGITRATLQDAFTFMATSMRPRVEDALWARLNPHAQTAVPFAEAARILVGLDVPARALPEVRVKLEAIREKLRTRYPPGQGMAGLRRGFAIMDRDRSGSLSAGELVTYLEKLGLRLTPYDADVLIAAFDRNGDGAVSLKEFCRAVRGPMSAQRSALVRLAFSQIDTDGSGELTIPELTERYDASKHPEVVAGRRTEEQIVAEFVEPWDSRTKVAGGSGAGDGVVSQAEFLDFYDDTSATIDDDEYFELMIRNCWHISGGHGAAQNTTCKRVLVEFKDGTQRVVEIKNDLGLRFDNMQAVRRRLEQQGVKDIALVKLK